MRMVLAAAAAAAAAAAVGLGGAGLAAASAAAGPDDTAAEARLERLIEERLRADGPFFTAQERAVIEQACGYVPGSWDGYEVNMSDGVFHCTNGRRVRSDEVQAVMEAAGPRIGARVSRTMSDPEVQGAIRRMARAASAEALRAVDVGRIAEEASQRAIEATRRATDETREARRRR